MTKHIDYEKFLEWIDEKIRESRFYLYDAIECGDYHNAIEYDHKLSVYEYIKKSTKTDDWTKRASFVRVDE